MSTTTVIHLLGTVSPTPRILYGRPPNFHLSERGRQMAELAAKWFTGRDIGAVLFAAGTGPETETISAAFGLPITVDERLVEAATISRAWPSLAFDRQPRTWRRLYNPFLPSWGEPYRKIVQRMNEVIGQVRKEAWGREAVCVSHQLPIWVTRRAAEQRRLWHRPDRRQCNMASVTSLTFEEERLVGVSYAEPAASLYPGSSSVPGA